MAFSSTLAPLHIVANNHRARDFTVRDLKERVMKSSFRGMFSSLEDLFTTSTDASTPSSSSRTLATSEMLFAAPASIADDTFNPASPFSMPPAFFSPKYSSATRHKLDVGSPSFYPNPNTRAKGGLTEPRAPSSLEDQMYKTPESETLSLEQQEDHIYETQTRGSWNLPRRITTTAHPGDANTTTNNNNYVSPLLFATHEPFHSTQTTLDHPDPWSCWSGRWTPLPPTASTTTCLSNNHMVLNNTTMTHPHNAAPAPFLTTSSPLIHVPANSVKQKDFSAPPEKTDSTNETGEISGPPFGYPSTLATSSNIYRSSTNSMGALANEPDNAAPSKVSTIININIISISINIIIIIIIVIIIIVAVVILLLFLFSFILHYIMNAEVGAPDSTPAKYYYIMPSKNQDMFISLLLA